MSSYIRRGYGWLREALSRRPGRLEKATDDTGSKTPFSDILNKLAEAKLLNEPPSVIVRPRIPFRNVLAAYFADSACRASTDELAFSAVGKGFYHTVNPEYEKADDVDELIDDFNEKANLDALLVVTAVHTAGFGNNLWLIGDPEEKHLMDVEKPIKQIPLTAIDSIDYQFVHEKIKVIDKPKSYNLASIWGGAKLSPDRIVHLRWNPVNASAFGRGIIHSLLEEGSFDGETRQCYLEMKWRLEKRMIDVFEKYVGPDELWIFAGASPDKLAEYQRLIKNKPKAGARFVYDKADADIKTVAVDPRSRFNSYVDHIMNQNYLGLQTPLAKALTTPGFTEASIKGAIELHEPVIFTMQRFMKREVERLWRIIIQEGGYDPVKAHCRLNWGMREEPEIELADVVKLAEISANSGIQYIRPDEVRKILVKMGFELIEPQEGQSTTGEATESRGPEVVFEVRRRIEHPKRRP